MENLARSLQKATSDPALCNALLKRIHYGLGERKIRFMEVCGTHTTSIFQSGIRSLLPKNLVHISGPGCPVCVTDDLEVQLFLDICQRPKAIIATFGDLMRVPGPDGISLKDMQANGAHVKIVYSQLDAIKLAKEYPDFEIIFIGVGFETTAPGAAAAILTAKKENIENFSLFSFHKLVPPVLKKLLSESGNSIDALLLPGHVATITGLRPFEFITEQFATGAVVGGFDPADILLALARLVEQQTPSLENAYPRAVSNNGNPRAQELLEKVFVPVDCAWRGLGCIPKSGLGLRDEFAEFDAIKKFNLPIPTHHHKTACRCGDVLKGKISPPQCALFAKKCTPASPVGPCMVSTEGSCSAWYKYGEL